MYEINRFHHRVRDPAPLYAEGGAESESMGAECALEDLRSAPDGELPRVLARFAVLRFWLIATAEKSPPEWRDHAREAAEAHLAFAAEGWPEATALRELLQQPEPLEAASVHAAAAAARAESEGHRYGAYAALRASYVIARRRFDLTRAAEQARALGALAERAGSTRAAGRWIRQARRLDRIARSCLPLSPH